MSITIEREYRKLQGRTEEARTEWDDIKVGQHLLWNHAGESRVVGIESETKKYKTIQMQDQGSSEIWTRTLGKNTLMAVKEDQAL